MQKSILVGYSLQQLNEHGSIPILYLIEQESKNVIQIHCKVDLKEEEIPEWLNPKQFTIRKVFSPGNPGVYVTELSSIKCSTLYAASFVNSTHEQISLAEKLYQ